MTRKQIDGVILRASLIGLKQMRDELDNSISTVTSMLGKYAVADSSHGRPRRKRRLSAEGRARIAAAQRRRWRQIRAQAADTKHSQEKGQA